MPIERQNFESPKQEIDNNSQIKTEQYNPNLDLKAEIAKMEANEKLLENY
jgi:hypothetical protein